MRELTKEDYYLFEQFINKYKSNYDPKLLQFIIHKFVVDFPNKRHYDVLEEIYAKLGLLEDSKNRYIGFYNMIEEIYGLEKNILEIGCGAYPYLAELIDQKQKHGKITVYDKYLVPDKLGNIRLYKRNFTVKDKIGNNNLIIGIAPCESTTLIISKACKSRKDFFIGMCGCIHIPEVYSINKVYSYDDWLNYIYNFIEERLPKNRKLLVSRLNDSYNYNYPIIYTRKK